MTRKVSHFQQNELILESFLRNLRYKRVLKHIPKNSTVLDAGCGYTSHLLQKIQREIKAGIGVDVSVAKSNLKKITLLKADLNHRLPLENNFFNVVVSMANLEHLSHPKQALQEFYRILKPKGKLIITTPSIYNKPILEFLAYRIHIISDEEIRDHKSYYRHKSLFNDLTSVGFKNNNIQISYFQFGLNIFAIAIK